MPTDVAPSNSDCKRTVSAYSGPEDAAASGRAQQVGGGVSGWIEDTFYDNDDDEPVQNQEQPTGHDTRSEPPPHSIQPPPLTNNPTGPLRGLGLDTGEDAWLHLEQLTAAIQHYNTNSKVAIWCNRIEQDQWGKVLALVVEQDIVGPMRRLRGHNAKYAKTILEHKRAGLSGIYPMHIPGHWRLMIVSHAMKQVLLLDPRDDCFLDREIQNIRGAFVGYSLIDRKDFLQTDDFNCGVWVAWIASLWTQHVNLNLEGSKDITEVITDGIREEGVHDLRNQYAKRPLNIASARRLRLRLREKLYADTQPAHLISWVDTWGTNFTEIRYGSTVTSLNNTANHTNGPHIRTRERDTNTTPPAHTEKAQSPNKHTHRPNQHHSRELTERTPRGTNGHTYGRETPPAQPTEPRAQPTPT